MRKKVLYICIAITWWLTNIASAQNYFTEGTRWTELKLDTLKYDSWFTEVNKDGSAVYVPNYERTDFYIHGDTTRASTKYMKVWRHIEGQPDSVALLIKNWEIPRVVISSLYFRSYGSIAASCPVYDFQWEPGKELYCLRLSSCQITQRRIPYIFGTIEEIQTGSFGTSTPLEYVELNGRTIIKGIGITSWNGRDCIFGPPEAWYMEWTVNSKVRNDYRSILVHFERDGEVLYDLWPTPEGGLASHIQSPKVNRADDTSVYDLQGRKVEGKPSRGIYIIGGKKRVVE